MSYRGLGAIVAFGALSACLEPVMTDEPSWQIRRPRPKQKRIADPEKKATRKHQKKARAITRAHRK